MKDLNQGFQLPRQSFICTHTPTAHDVLAPPELQLRCMRLDGVVRSKASVSTTGLCAKPLITAVRLLR